MPGARDSAVNKTKDSVCLQGAYFGGEGGVETGK